MDESNNPWGEIIIQNRELRNQNTKLDIIFILGILTFISLILIWGYNIYVKVDEINIYDCNNEVEVEDMDMDYLIEQNHYKQLSTDEKKQTYKKLNDREKILDIKKQLITNIMKT